jgi:ABC-2 type transport system ATP-binding protein
MIDVQGLSRSFGAVKAVDNLSFRVDRGEVFALLGPNGAGKTTTIKMILGLLRPDTGVITFDGALVEFGEIEYKARMGYVPENCALYENLTGREFLEFVGNLHHLDPELIHSRSRQLLELMELDTRAGELIRDYSKGMKQKILILSALLHDPDLIILDEPFSGLDANATSVFKEMIQQIAGQGKTVIFCSHVLEVVEKLVDRILIIKQGQELITGTPEEIVRQTGLQSLDRAFNALTGATDVDSRARKIIDIIGNDSVEDGLDGH